MLQRDYIMKMTEMFAAVMTKVLFKKENKNYEEALKELEAEGKKIAGLDFEMFRVLKIDDIISLMKTSDVYAGRCLISGEILLEYADILREKGDAESRDFYYRSFRIYTEALLTKEIPDPEIYFKKTDAVLNQLMTAGFFNKEIPEDLTALFEYYNLTGKFSKAEDVLFRLLESEKTGSELKSRMKKRAVAFYKELMETDESELVKGNFTSDEARYGLEEIMDMIKLNLNQTD